MRYAHLVLTAVSIAMPGAIAAQPAEQGAGRAALAAGPRLAQGPFASLAWRNIGPSSIGGRVDAVAVSRVRGQPDQIYIAASSGGVFKSTNGGTSWAPVFDGPGGSLSMGDVAVSPSHPNIVWVGTGEARTVAYHWGDGVYKSTDAGRTWTHMGLRETRHIGRVLIHPSNPDIVLVAAQGRMWGPNAERGIYKTTDGGKTWKHVLRIDVNTGANDIVADPTNPSVLYASSYQRQRHHYGGVPVGPGSGIWKSTDGGDTWRRITNGLPKVEMGRIGLHVSPVDPKMVFADIEVGGSRYPAPQGSDGDCMPWGRGQNAFDSDGGVFRSLDGGETWEQVYSRLDQPAGYFVVIRADPQDGNRVYRLGLQLYVSDDMGKTFRTMPTRLHADFHALWIDPDNNNHMIVGNDGSVAITHDRGVTWDHRDNIPMSQFWEMSVDNRDPFYVCGGTQDNGNWCLPSATRNRNGISNRDAFSLGGGDGMHFHIDPRDTNYAFIQTNSVTTTSSIQRLNLASLQRQGTEPGLGRPVTCYEIDSVRAKGYRGLGRGVGDDPSYRWAWVAPLAFSSVTPGVVYTAGNALFKSTDRGSSWMRISGDLSSRVDRDTIRVMGKVIGTVNLSPGGGPSTNPLSTPLFGQVSWISESPLNTRVLYTGTDDGQLSVTRDGGATWTNVTKNVPGLRSHTFVSSVVASKHAASRVYATFDGKYNNDDSTYVYVSENYGQSWRRITNGLPRTSVTRLIEHPRSPHLLVVSHTFGIHFSNDRGATWQSLASNFPTVPTRAIVFHERENALVAGTYGRGIWILDDVSPLEVLTAENVAKEAVFVSATRGRQMQVFPLGPTYGAAVFYAPNPEYNSIISYHLRAPHAGATITISDASGSVVWEMQGPATAGLNSVEWDLRHNPVRVSEAQVVLAGGGGGGGRNASPSALAGPLVRPGEYTIRVSIPGIATPLRGTVRVNADPLERMTVAARDARHATIMRIYALQQQLATARGATQRLVTQMDSVRADLRAGGAPAAAAADSIGQQLTMTANELDRLLTLNGSFVRALESFNTTATVDQRQQIAWAREDASRAVATLNNLSQSRIPALYRRFAPSARPRTVPAAPVPPT